MLRVSYVGALESGFAVLLGQMLLVVDSNCTPGLSWLASGRYVISAACQRTLLLVIVEILLNEVLLETLTQSLRGACGLAGELLV